MNCKNFLQFIFFLYLCSRFSRGAPFIGGAENRPSKLIWIMPA